MQRVRQYIQSLLGRVGYRLTKIEASGPDEEFARLNTLVAPYTMTSWERRQALYDAVKYISLNRIEGDVVECGVWRGGSSMLAAHTLINSGDTDRTLYLYDTYSGMTEPTERDVNLHGTIAKKRWKELERDTHNEWDYASLEEVKANMESTGYPAGKLVFVKGRVEETIPATMPDKIALLRLDTDWYESTLHELTHLYPRLVPGGVVIFDDYGHWQGAREAVDEYFEAHGHRPLLFRADYSGRVGVKR